MENEAPTVANLIIIRRNGKDSSHPRELTVEDEEMVVGRTDDCDLCIKLPVVSRKQATFRFCKFSTPDHAINPDDPASSSDALGVYVIANFGTTNPTKINDKAVGPPGREYVMRHKDIITVADRKFRLEYVGGVTPSGADSVQQTLDREWLQKKKVQQTQPAKQGKDQPGGNCTENSHPNNNTDATQDLSKFVRAASGSRKGGLGDKTKTFGQRLETVAENKATHHPKPPSKHDMTKTPAKKDIGAAVKARPPVASSEEKKPAVQSGDETSAEKEGKAKGNNCSPAMSIDSFANNVATPGGGNNDLVEFSGGVDNENEAGAVPSISSQPILTFTPDEPSSPEAFSSFPQRGNSISSAVNYESNIQESSLADVEITATFNQEATSGEDTSTPIDVKLPAKALDTPMKESIAQVASNMAENRSTLPSKALPTPAKQGIANAAATMAENRDDKLPPKALPTPLKVDITIAAPDMLFNRIKTMPLSSLPTPMKTNISQAATEMAENRAEMTSSTLPTPMKATIAQAANAMAEGRAEVPSSALPTPMKASISQVASAMAEGRAEVPSSALPTPMKAGISQVASEMAGNRSQVPSSSLPTPMKATIAQAANAMAEGRAKVPSSALPTPMKATIAQAANAMAEGRAEVPSSALPMPMKADISQVASAMVENRSVMPTSSLPTPMKATIAQAANAMAEGRAKVPSSALPTPMKTNIASAAAAMSKALANKLPLKALPTPIKTNIASAAAVVGKNLADKLPPKALPTPAKESIAGAATAFTERQAKKTDEHLPIESVANTGENVEEASGVIENSTMASGVMEAEEVDDVFVSVGGQQSAIENNASEGGFEGAETASEVVNASSSTEAVDMSVDDPTHPEEAHSAVEKSEMPMDEPVTEEESSLAEVEAPLAEEEPVALQERLIETNKEEVEQGTDDEWEIVDADSIRNETKTLSAKDTEQLRANDKLQEESAETVGGDAEPEDGTAGAAEEAVLDEMESEDAIELPPDAIEDTTTECKDIDMNLPTDEEVVGKCTVDQPSPEESSATMDIEEAIIKSAAEDDDVKASIDDAVFGKQDDVQETVDNVEVKERARVSTEEEEEEKEATAASAGDDDVTDERAEVEADDEGVALDENKVDPITTPGTNGIEKTEPPVQEDVQEEEGEDYGLTPELIAGLNYNELRSTCKDHGLPANGKAHDLKERLLQLCSSSQGNMEEECEVEEKKADEVEDEVEEKKVEQVDGKRDDGNDEAMETEETPHKSSEDAQEEDSGLTPEFIAGLNYNELRSTCKDHGLPANGKTGDLKARLLQLVRSDKETMETDESSTSLGTSKRSYEKQAEGEPDSKRQKVDEKEGEDSGLTPEVIAGLKYTELRSTCKAHGLPANGKTADLKARLLSLVSS